MGRPLQLAVVAIATFCITRLIDHAVVSRQSSFATHRQLASTSVHVVPRLQPTASPSGPAREVHSADMPRGRQPHLAVIGFPVGIDERNRARRALLRELWYPEYENLGPDSSVRCEFVIGLQTYQGDGHAESIVEQLHDEHVRFRDLALVNAREATRDPYRGDPKCTGEKILAWFQQVVVVHRGTRFFIKADWDSWIHTIRLETNLRALLVPRHGALYFGNTLWCSYSLEDFQPCGYGFGPLQAAGAKRSECPALPHGRHAIGPYPYTAGLMWGMSYELVQWIAGSRLVYDFWHNASSRYEPPYWVRPVDHPVGRPVSRPVGRRVGWLLLDGRTFGRRFLPLTRPGSASSRQRDHARLDHARLDHASLEHAHRSRAKTRHSASLLTLYASCPLSPSMPLCDCPHSSCALVVRARGAGSWCALVPPCAPSAECACWSWPGAFPKTQPHPLGLACHPRWVRVSFGRRAWVVHAAHLEHHSRRPLDAHACGLRTGHTPGIAHVPCIATAACIANSARAAVQARQRAPVLALRRRLCERPVARRRHPASTDVPTITAAL